VIIDETEEDTLRKIFESEGPTSSATPKIPSTGTPPPVQASPRYIELKLGKRITIQPGEERSLSVALQTRLAEGKKYNLLGHFDFLARFEQQVAMTLELINRTTVQVDLKNVSNAAVVVEAEQYVVLLEERRPPPMNKVRQLKKQQHQQQKQRPIIKSARNSSSSIVEQAAGESASHVPARKNSGSSRGGSVSPEGRISPKQGRSPSGGAGPPTLKYDIRKGSWPQTCYDNKYIRATFKQCCGSVTFWYGSGSESTDPDLDPDPDPAIFVSDLQDGN
jgi:hypothetical protein